MGTFPPFPSAMIRGVAFSLGASPSVVPRGASATSGVHLSGTHGATFASTLPVGRPLASMENATRSRSPPSTRATAPP